MTRNQFCFVLLGLIFAIAVIAMFSITIATHH